MLRDGRRRESDLGPLAAPGRGGGRKIEPREEQRKGKCRQCGLAIEFMVTRSAWVHAKQGIDHGPVP